MCDVFMMSAMCHHSSHGTSTSHLYIYLQCVGDTHEQKEGLLQRRNNTTKKHGSAVFDTASLSYPEAATNFMAQDRVRAYVC